MTRRSFALLSALFVVVLALTTTRFTAAHEGGPHLRVAHLSTGSPAVDVFINDQKRAENLQYKEVTKYIGVEGYTFKIVIVPAGGKISDSLTKEPLMLTFKTGDSGHYTIAAVGSLTEKTFEVLLLPEDNPAPKVTGTPIAKASGTVGALTISNAFARPTSTGGDHGGMGGGTAMPTSGISAAYLTIQNGGDKADKLLSVTSDIAGRAEIHETVVKNDIASMQAIPGGLVIPAKGSVELKPGGYHIMLLDLKKDLVEGSTIALTLTFESGAKLTLNVPVLKS